MVAGGHGAQQRARRGDVHPRRAHEPVAVARGDRRARLRATGATIRVLSDRLRPYAIDAGTPARRGRAARAPRGAADRLARGLRPGLLRRGRRAVRSRSGPGRTERSHTAGRVRAGERDPGRRALLRAARAARTRVARRRGKRRGPALGQGEPLDELVLRYTGGRGPRARRPPRRRTTCGPRSPTPRCSAARASSTAEDSTKLVAAARGPRRRRTSAGEWKIVARGRGLPHRAREPPRAGARRRRRAGSTSAARATTRCSRRCGSTLQDALEQLAAATPGSWPRRSRSSARGTATSRCPATPTSSRAMPSTVRLWAGGFAAELRDDADGLRAARRRADKNPLGSAAGYGVPLLPLDREATTARRSASPRPTSR